MTVGLHLTNQCQPIARNLKKQPAVTLQFSRTLQKNRKLFTSVCDTTGNRTSMPGEKWLFKKLCVLPILYTLIEKPKACGNVDFPGGTSGKEPTRMQVDLRDTSLIPGWGRSPGEKNGDPL